MSTVDEAVTETLVAPRPGDPEITPELVADHGLSVEEYERILDLMGRQLTFTELGVFSAMWSEHCGYKNSKRLLRLLPTEAPWVIQGPGENAGVIDVGEGYALAFKIESHNHPSAVEPYQGAATGVGGILRDIFTMGARPVAVLDSLRFGDLDSGRVRYLFGEVVAGVGDYGNCIGVPNIGGEVVFDRGYEGNPIVNAMCLGLMKREDLITASASGVGNPVMAVGHPGTVGNWVVTVGEVVSVDPDVWILADVSVAQGNSGGPAVNQDGEVIGVVSGRTTSGDVFLTGVYDLKIILDLQDYTTPMLTTIEPGGAVAAMIQRHQ